jgi:hypothetical protein
MQKIKISNSTVHKILWLFFLGFTIIIILWPVTPSMYNPLPVQTIYAINSFPLFIVVFFIWVLNLACLLFFMQGNAGERLALCLGFMLVFVQFWGFKVSPWGNTIDSDWLIGHVNYLNHIATIPNTGQSVLRYFDFPGLIFVGSALKNIFGANLFLSVDIYLLLSGVIFTVIFFVTFLKILKNSSLASIGVVFAIVSSTALGGISNQFHPINLASIFICIFLLILVSREIEGFSDLKITIIFIILIMGSTIEYMYTPVFILLVLFSIYISRHLSKSSSNIPLIIVLLPLVFFLSWEIYWTVWSLYSNVIDLSQAWQSIFNGQWLLPTELTLRQNVGAAYPWWGNVTKLFWWIAVFGSGTFIMFRWLFHWRQANASRRMQIAIFVGILLTVIVGSFSGGIIGVEHGGIERYIWVAPFVLIPAIIGLLSKLKSKNTKIIFSLLSLLLIFPTFLTDADTISVDHIYYSEVKAFQILTMSEKTDYFTIYGFPDVSAASYIYMPDVSIIDGAYLYGGADETEAWNSLQNNVKEFLSGDPSSTFAVISVKSRQIYRQYLGVSIDDPKWNALETELSRGNRIYDGGNLQFYSPS